MKGILIIDSNRTFRRSLEKQLAAQFPEMEIRTLGSVADALERLEGGESIEADVVFADMGTLADRQPELARVFKQEAPHRTLVLMCSFDIPEYRQAAYRSGADYCLLKSETTFEGIAGLIAFLRDRGREPRRGGSGS